MKKFAKYYDLIQKDYPGFSISSIKKIGEGDNSKAFVVNKNYIFRFPKKGKVKHQIQREVCVLPKIKSAVGISIPDFEFISPALNFVGYQKINGHILSDKILRSLSKNQQVEIHKTLGNFLTQIHSFPLSCLENCGLETMDLKEEYSDNFKNAKKEIFPFISKKKREIISHFFNQYLSDDNNFKYTAALVHNDFSKDHILIDTGNKQISGIIDFGDIAIGDPSYDFLYSLDEFGKRFLKEVFRYYDNPMQNIPLAKIQFFSLANKIQIALESLKENNNENRKETFKELNFQLKDFKKKKVPSCKKTKI